MKDFIFGISFDELLNKNSEMRTFIGLVLWFILFVICWPIALIMLVLFPFVWLLLLPFRIVGFTLELVFSLIKGILLFPFKLVKAI
jgi:hypothetical protein